MDPEYIKQLIAKYAEQSASPEEVDTLMDWYRKESNKSATWFVESEQEKEHVYKRMLYRLKADISRSEKNTFSWLKVAAAILLLLSASVLTYYFASKSDSYVLITNSHGQIRQITLPDSSRVWLNSASTIEYDPAFMENRDIKLEGEAYFEVEPDKRHPFTVHTQKLNTTVLGTSFNIKSFSDDNFIDVSVAHGKVSVGESNRQLALLTHNKALRFDKQHNKAEEYSSDSTEFSSWREGKLQFSGEAMIEITKTLERWYGYTFIFDNNNLKPCRYYMNFDNYLPLDTIIGLMQQITNLKFTINNTSKSVIITGDACS